MVLHTQPFRGQGGLQHCQRKKKSTVLSPPVSKEWKAIPYSVKLNQARG
jgi:hypothetical protein